MNTRNGQNCHRFHLRLLWGQGYPPPPLNPPKPHPWKTKIGQNDYNWVTRPPIKILRALVTLQLLILLNKNPFYAQKKLKLRAKIEVFAFELTISMVKLQNEDKIGKIINFWP